MTKSSTHVLIFFYSCIPVFHILVMPCTAQRNPGTCVETKSSALGKCVLVDNSSEMTPEQWQHALVTLLTRWQAFKENRRDRSPGAMCR